MRKKTRTKLRWLLLVLLLPLNMVAQFDDSHGLFGKGGSPDDTGIFSSIINQGFGATSGGLFNQSFGFTQDYLDNQGFGSTQGGITNQTFEEEAPLGSGLFVLLAAGAGYAILKTKKRKSNR